MLISWLLFPPLAKSNTWLRQDVDFAFSPAKGGDRARCSVVPATRQCLRLAARPMPALSPPPAAGEKATSWAWAEAQVLEVARGGSISSTKDHPPPLVAVELALEYSYLTVDFGVRLHLALVHEPWSNLACPEDRISGNYVSLS